MTPEDKKIWESVARTIKPLKRKKKQNTENEPSTISRHTLHESSLDTQSKKEDEEHPVLPLKEKERSFVRPHIHLNQDRSLTKKLRQGTCIIQATLDLHGQTQDQAYVSLQQFLAWALNRKLKLVLIITGKGVSKKPFSSLEKGGEFPVGILRKKVPEWLENTKEFPGVLSVSIARPQEGGVGALYIELRSSSKI